ncbi:hypothetical protein L7F22_023847 [Adiantum nelumboides]|nr:hypothetical protein [Adiantum nelumboides]
MVESSWYWLARKTYGQVDGAVASAVTVLLRWFGVRLQSTPPTHGLPAVDSPTPILLLISLYLAFVAGGLVWIRACALVPPRRKEEAAPLRALVLLHNAFCLSLSLYMALGLSLSAYQLGYVIMVLKHNVRQITVLHVYHHISVAFIWWMIAHHAPGGDAYLSAALNSFVHVFMYLYYLLSALWRDVPTKKQAYLFWGR